MLFYRIFGIRSDYFAEAGFLWDCAFKPEITTKVRRRKDIAKLKVQSVKCKNKIRNRLSLLMKASASTKFFNVPFDNLSYDNKILLYGKGSGWQSRAIDEAGACLKRRGDDFLTG